MSKFIVVVNGSYRRGGITDQSIEALLKPARKAGAEIRHIRLVEMKIDFCKNCRSCTCDAPELRRGRCVIADDMESILSDIDRCDALVLASPANFSQVTAVMKMFLERLITYAYWPWEKPFPVNRIKTVGKKAAVMTSSAAPELLGRLLMPGMMKQMAAGAKLVGAKVSGSVYFGLSCSSSDQKLSRKQIRKVESVGAGLIR